MGKNKKKRQSGVKTEIKKETGTTNQDNQLNNASLQHVAKPKSSVELVPKKEVNNVAKQVHEMKVDQQANKEVDQHKSIANDVSTKGMRNENSKTQLPWRQSQKLNNEMDIKLDAYMKSACFDKSLKYEHVQEIEADLFAMADEFALAHCVAEDFNMGSGIAIQFRQKFQNVAELLSQRVKQGGLATLEHKGRFIYYLVTKKESNGKPTLQTMFKSVYKLKEHMVKNNVEKLAIPRIGCGLDRLEWNKVKNLIENIFHDTTCNITVCNFQQADRVMATTIEKHRKRKCIVVNEEKSITFMEEYAIIIYIGAEEDCITPEMRELNSKYNIMSDYNRTKRDLGTLVKTVVHPDLYLLYGCIVKKYEKDEIDFVLFQKCISNINKMNQKLVNKYEYVGMQVIYDKDDVVIMSKIVNLMRNSFYNVDIYLYPNPINRGVWRKRVYRPHHSSKRRKMD